MTGQWITAERAQEIRTSGTRLGAAIIVAAAVLGTLIALVGLALRTSGNALDTIAWILGAAGVLPLLLAGTIVVNARSHVHGTHLDVPGARKALRALALMWVCAFLIAILAGAARLVASRNAPAPFPAAGWIYLLLLATVVVLAGVAFAAGRSLLRSGT